MRKLNLTFVLLILLLSFETTAQEYLGLHSSNYLGVNGLGLQPASVVDNRLHHDGNVLGFTVSGYNNYIQFDTEGFKRSNWDVDDYGDKFLSEVRKDGKAKSLYVNNEITLPSYMYSNNKWGIGFNWRLRTMVNIDGVSEQLGKLLLEELEYPTLWITNLNNKDLSIQTMTWADYGITYGRVLRDHDEHFMKMGGTVKLLQGLQGGYMFIDDLKYEFYNADTLSLFTTDVEYGHSDNFEVDQDEIKYKFIANPTVGLDLGFVYEFRPNHADYKYDMDGQEGLWRDDLNKYKFRAGVAITDIGRIKFGKGDLSRDFHADITDMPLSEFDDVETVFDFDDSLNNKFDFNTNDEDFFTMQLPTAISLQLDYNIHKDFYLNVTPFWALQFKNDKNKVHHMTRYTVTPRWDHKWFGAAIPVSMSSFYGFNYGLGLRLGPVLIGTSNIKPVVKMGNVRGGDLYFALKVPIPHRHPKDRDKDKVSDKMDECIDVPGVWAFKGCPDTDGDGIQDTKDDCPAEAGLIEFNGCPDTDGDGIIDKNDSCVTVAGIAQFFGCPDTDSDGIQDSKDDCPEEAGLAQFNGCPDRDNDGVKDSDDLCPDNPGPVENQGCPDTDKDGIFDYLDECPEVPGPAENRGCPYPDTDGDGLLDKDDQCPTIAGPKENNGCPYKDTDGDTVLDKDDMCPTTPGTVENNGCPEIKKEEQEIINTAFDNLEFETGKAVIKFESYESLEELGKLLVKKPDWKLKIAGHTDNVGSARSNLVLSKKRAEALRDFLAERGISAERFIVEYYGEEKPIETNDTREGRQKNRRVEMIIVFE